MAQLAMQRKRFMEASQLAGEKTENEEGEVSGQDAKSGGASSSSSGGQAKSSSPRKNTQGSDKLGAGGGEGSSSKTETEDPQTGSTMTEYTCCHCLLQTAATESRPIGKIPESVFFFHHRDGAVVNVKIETLMYLEILEVTKRV